MAANLYLTLHGIGAPSVGTRDLDCEMWIDRERFEGLLQNLPSRVSITFDDGFECCWGIAFPELRKRGMMARFFVLTGLLGKKGYLTEEQVIEMSREGMSIGTHGMYHRPWRKLGAATLREEIFEAKERLESLLGKPVTEAACPFGVYDRRALNSLRRCGIERVYTSDRALPNPNSWIVPRYTIRRSDTQAYLEEVLAGKHDASLMGRVKMLLKRYR
jgi:peptidoglycan/xylan/chitin deacetylase (PgdA/CDA1 family)